MTSSFIVGNAINAAPALQLGITGGFYNESGSGIPDEETIFSAANADTFTLNAYLKDANNTPLNGEYVLSTALISNTGSSISSSGNYGSFDISYYDYDSNSNISKTIAVTGDMIYVLHH